jgi:CheY-like chemotaxis protein
MKKPRIFIVEDVELQMLHLRTELEGLGYEVVGSAASGEDAVEKISATRPDLLLLDIHLAGEMNGTDVARRVNERSDIPFIYLTAYSDEETFAKTIGTKPRIHTRLYMDGPRLQIRLAMSNARREDADGTGR